MLRRLLLAVGLAHGVARASAQTAAFSFAVVCFDSSGSQFPCGNIHTVQTVRENNAGARFSFSTGGADPNAGGVVLDPVATNLNSTADTPTGTGDTSNDCPIEQFCECTGTQVTNIVIGNQDASGVIGCTGFVESNTTAIEELQNVSSATCAIEVIALVNVTQPDNSIRLENVTFCFSDPTLITPEDTCNDNTAVIVIIIICMLMLLVVLVVGAYYLVHGNTLEGRPIENKVVSNSKIA